MEVYIDSSIVIDSLNDISSVTGSKKKEDRVAIEKIIDLKQNKKIICIRTINTEYEIAKDNRQGEINQKWGEFIIRDACIGLMANLKQKDYDPEWDCRFEELKGICSRRHIDISILVQAEYFGIRYIVTTDYRFIRSCNSKSKIVEVIRPIDFIRKIDIR